MGAVAVLIDGDNLSAKHAARVVQIAAALGRSMLSLGVL